MSRRPAALLAVLLLLAPAAHARFRRPLPVRQRPCAAAARRLTTFEQHALLQPSCGRPEGCTPRAQRRHTHLAVSFADHCVALNQIQVLGTHNSYHIQPSEPYFSHLLANIPAFQAWEYTHPPLDQQFEHEGIRQIELDVFADPAGGLFAVRHGPELVGDDPGPTPPQLLQPGFKVLHVQDLDFQSNCFTFVECLQTVKAWSDTHLAHLPIMILIEAKDDPLFENLGFAVPIPIGPAEFDALDAEIRSVFPAERLITPDDVRGKAATVEAAVRGRGWPSLRTARGKVLFTLDNASKRDAYLEGHPDLAERVLFTNSNPGSADAAFVERNDPLGDPTRIPDLVRMGYIVRTRADGDTVEARSGDTTMRDAAIASGAQYVSTDYPVENPAFGTGYVVRIPDASPARCNPVNGPTACRSAALELLP